MGSVLTKNRGSARTTIWYADDADKLHVSPGCIHCTKKTDVPTIPQLSPASNPNSSRSLPPKPLDSSDSSSTHSMRSTSTLGPDENDGDHPNDNRSTDAQGTRDANDLYVTIMEAGSVVSCTDETEPKTIYSRLQTGKTLVLTCLFYATYHGMDPRGLLKLTAVLLESDSEKRLKELDQRSGQMAFGQLIHEDCHYLYDYHKGDVIVEVSGFQEGWQLVNCGTDDSVVKVFEYKKLWDGKTGIRYFYFEKTAGRNPHMFSANFQIQQDGPTEELTTFDICEPVSRLIAEAPVARGIGTSLMVRAYSGDAPPYSDDDESSTPTVRSNDSA